MNKFIIFSLGLLAIVDVLHAQDDLPPEIDRYQIIVDAVGDISSLKDWMQQVIQKKLEILQTRFSNNPLRELGTAAGFFILTEEEMAGIEIPKWFTRFQGDIKAWRYIPCEDRPELLLGDHVKGWFKTYFVDYEIRFDTAVLDFLAQEPELDTY